MTMKLEQAARQALKALEELNYSSGTVVAARMYESATAALREALAEQAEQEPVAEVVLRKQTVGFGRTEERKDVMFLADVGVGSKLYAKPQQQAEQEPVIDLSKVRHEDKCRYWDDEIFCDCGADSHELLKWYRKNAAPVRTKDLTADEIEEFYTRIWSGGKKSMFAFARAVIAADREKNRG